MAMYREHLAHCYQLVIASEPLLEQAIACLGADGAEGELRAFYEKHLDDERHHAKWLLEDLDGYAGTLHFGMAAVAGLGYYLVLHAHPAALLGYMLALESMPISQEFIDGVVAECGEKATRTLRIHAEEDPKHAAEIAEVIARIPNEWKPLVVNTRRQVELMLKGS